MKGDVGFVSLSKAEQEKIKGTSFLNTIGRPKKPEEDRQQVESMRFSLKEKISSPFLQRNMAVTVGKNMSNRL